MSELKPPEAGSWTESQMMMMEGGAWQENTLPVSAAQVFSPASTSIKESWEMEAEKRPFLQQHFVQEEWPEEKPPRGRCCSERVVLKMAVSLGTAALFFPFLLWGGYVFLPFDAPVMDSAPLRLVYTLRCCVFASLPVALGYLVLGVSRFRSGEVQSLCETEGCGSVGLKRTGINDVSVHRGFVSDSTHLFLLYFLQLAVMATYLSQEQLKLVPLLTLLFCLGRLVYWVAAMFQSSIRAFGFGLSFLPSLAMIAANLYFLVTMEMSGGAFSPPQKEQAPPQGRQRFWG
ncbi:transmembrane protein 79-like [Periophthalmus magnuspinnatus]|uniref:transmembrane protein 79-like n=1 Tax=Periophthalmus magnuspinnatus TaxID=409849 RepID=UPI00145B0AE9|nr:transmembrane protein 79-like [Periophthalmus magnuspinnatus]